MSILWNTGALACYGAGEGGYLQLFGCSSRKLPTSDSLDLANSTCLGCGFSFCPTRFSRKRAGAPPPDSTFTPDGHQPSAVPGAAKYIYSLPHVTSRLYVGVFLGIQCARLNFLLYVVLILYRLITYPIGSLANADIRVWRLRPIHFPHVHHLSYRHA